MKKSKKTSQHIQNAAKAILTRNLMVINAYIKKNLKKANFLPLGTREKTINYTQVSRTKEIKKIRAEIKEIKKIRKDQQN